MHYFDSPGKGREGSADLPTVLAPESSDYGPLSANTRRVARVSRWAGERAVTRSVRGPLTEAADHDTLVGPITRGPRQLAVMDHRVCTTPARSGRAPRAHRAPSLCAAASDSSRAGKLAARFRLSIPVSGMSTGVLQLDGRRKASATVRRDLRTDRRMPAGRCRRPAPTPGSPERAGSEARLPDKPEVRTRDHRQDRRPAPDGRGPARLGGIGRAGGLCRHKNAAPGYRADRDVAKTAHEDDAAARYDQAATESFGAAPPAADPRAAAARGRAKAEYF